MDRETNDLIARLYLREKNLSEVEPGEFAKWAALELERGHDTLSLRRLIFESANAQDDLVAEPLFRECVTELGWEIPGKKAALKGYSETIMQKIVNGEIEPYDGCSNLYIIAIFLKHPDYLYNWNGLFWAREDLGIDELNALILEEAKRSLRGEEPSVMDLPHHDEDDEEAAGFWDSVRKLIKRK